MTTKNNFEATVPSLIEQEGAEAPREREGQLYQKKQRGRVYAATAVGSVVEYYDFLIYATAASLVFPYIFFPEDSGVAAVIGSFGTLAFGYFARPLGGVIFGHLADRYGRKRILMWTLMLMAVSTLLMGLLPTYHQIGVFAPALLVVLRLVQGFAVGGEWGAAALLAVEHAAPQRRGMLGSAPQVGMAGGLLLSIGAFAALGSLAQEDFLSWGWRLPFLATIVMAAVGLFLRLRVAESPIHKPVNRDTNSKKPRKLPLLTVLKDRPMRLLLGTFVYVGPFMAYTVATTMLISYANTEFGVDRGVLLNGMMIGVVGMLVTIPIFATLSDRIGRRRVYVTSALLTAIWAFIMFPLVTSGSFVLIALSFIVSMTFLNASAMSALPALLSELFPTSVRASGVGLSYQIGGVIGGGLGPLLAMTFITPGGPGTIAVSVMISALCLVAAICMWVLGDTRKVDLRNA